LSSDVSRFETLKRVILSKGSVEMEAVIERTWLHDGNLVLKFAGIDSISAAEGLAGMDVCVPWLERRALEAGEVFIDDLVGCKVVDAGSGAILGRVESFHETGGPGLLELENGILIPFAREICRSIEPESRRIVVELPEGLKELNAP
jgi:16S rRNA processing protein RimM